MKVYMFGQVSEGGPSFGALRREDWKAFGILRLACTDGLIVPAALHWQPALTVVAAAFLTIESLVFVWVHARYREVTPIVLSSVLGLLMAFIVYGRIVLKPISEQRAMVRYRDPQKETNDAILAEDLNSSRGWQRSGKEGRVQSDPTDT
jgi:hypothetical protein